ncbi:MAG TPA: ABC transporter ATP-binding protein, partial [Candidatus Paceibacterota bacterium]
MEKDYSNLHRGLVLKYFWQVMKRYKISFFVVIFSIVLVSIMDVYIPFQFLKLFNIFQTNDFSFVKQAQNLFIFIFILKIISWGLRRTIEFTNFYFVSHVEAGLREQAFSSMMQHSKSFFSNNFSGSLTQKINKYIRAFEKLNDRLVRDGIALVIKSIGTVFAIFILIPKYSYILAVFCFVFLLTAMIYTRLKLKYDIIAALADTKTHGSLADSISNHASVQVFAGHEYENDKIRKIVAEQQKAVIFNWNLWGGLGTIQGLLILVVEFIIYWNSIGDWRLGLITLPVIVLIQSYLGRLVENLWDFAGITKSFYEAFADAQEMAVVMNLPYEIKDINTEKLEKVKGEIVFDHVTYIYDKNNTKVFDDFSLIIPAGQKIALVGTSGAGKSTFVNLLMRLF